MPLKVLQACCLGLALAVAGMAAHADEDDIIAINFKDMELQQFIRYVADLVDLTVIIDPQVKGRINVVSDSSVGGPEELYDLFLSVLEVHGFTAVRAGDVVRVVPLKDARSASVPMAETSGPLARGGSEIITQVFQLENINAAKLIPILRPLVPQQSHMAAYTPSNAIIISDTAANVAKIEQIIDRIDLAAIEETEVIRLRYASADETVKILERLQKGGGEDQKSIKLVPDQRTNSILVNADELERQRIRLLVQRLDQPLEQSGNARVRYLEYANASDVADVLNRVAQNVSKLSPSGDGPGGAKTPAVVEADEATNALIITAETGQIEAIDAMIDRLDIRRAQVLVEAIIVEMVADGIKDLGIQWLFQSEDEGFGSSVDPAGTQGNILGGLVSAAAAGADGDSGDFNVGLGEVASVLAATPGQVFGIADIDQDGTSFLAVLNALQDNTQANILSTPSLLTLDNSEASINVGQQVPFVTGSFAGTGGGSTPNNPFQTIQRESIGTKLKVTPRVNEGDTIVLEIVQEVSSLTGLQAADIITNERKIESKIMVRDGSIVVLGGLIEDDVQERVQKVPLLGDIPGFGRLFRNTSTSKIKRNLLVFIRPTVIRDSAVLEGATAEKYRYIRDQQLQRRASGVDLLPIEDLPLLPEWEEQLREAERIRERSRAAEQGAAAESE